MSASTVAQDLLERVRRLERLVDDVKRYRSGRTPRLRELTDADLAQVQDGQVPVYSAASGLWQPGDAGSGGGGFPRFSLPGLVYVSTSGRDYPEATVTFTRIFASLRVAAASGTTTLRLLRNGSAVAGTTVSLGVGVLTIAATFSQAFTGPETDYMQVEVTSAGVGAYDLVVQVS